MRKILTLTLTLFIGLGLIAAEAEAKRFGGGKSFGMKRQSYSQPQRQQAPSNTSTTRQQTAGGTPARSGASRWLGPLAGLAAGGLLAALLFGDAFEGFQPMDLLLLLGAAAAIFFVMKKMGAPQPRPAPAGGAMGGQFRAGRPEEPGPSFEAPSIGGGLRGEPLGAATAGFDSAPTSTPAWFDEERFLHQAKVHFVRLQAAWDSGDMKEIREFTTPELFAELTLERQSIAGADNFTEVVEVTAELAGFAEEAGRSIASVRYRGLIREERDATANPFSETWHIVRDSGEADAEWFVAGIQQED